VDKIFVHQLRQEMTKAEACLWKYSLKAGKGKSIKRFQNVIAEIVKNIDELE